MRYAQPWLPEDALTGPGTAAPVAEVIEEWVRHWFTLPALRASSRWTRLPALAEEEGDSWSPAQPLSPHMTIQCRTDACDLLGRVLLPGPGPRGFQHAQDRQLMQSVSDSILADLTDRLERFAAGLGVPAPSPENSRSALNFSLAIEDHAERTLIRILANASLMVGLARRGIEKQREIGGLVGRTAALADSRIACGIRLGRANLPYPDVRNLGVGDVIILASKREVPCDLLVDGKVAAHRAIQVPIAEPVLLSQ